MGNFQILLLAACAPVFLILLWVQRRDRLPEPAKVVWLTLLFGGLMTLPIIVVELAGASTLGIGDEAGSYGEAALDAFVIAALVEEVGKFIVLWFYCARHSEFDEPLDGIVYGVAASMGFALVENLMYVLGNEQPMVTAAVRAITAVPMHAFCGVIMGTCIGIAKFQPPQRPLWIALGLGGAIGVHGLYDFGLFGSVYGASIEHLPGVAFGILGSIATLLLSGMISVLAIARFRRDQERAMLAMAADDHAMADEATGGSCYSPDSTESGSSEEFAEQAEPQEFSSPKMRNAAPVLPMVALVGAGAASTCFVTVFVAAIALSIRQEAGADAPALETLAGLAVFATLALAAVSGAISIVAIVREPRWRVASIVALVISTLLLLLSLGLIVLGLLADGE